MLRQKYVLIWFFAFFSKLIRFNGFVFSVKNTESHIHKYHFFKVRFVEAMIHVALLGNKFSCNSLSETGLYSHFYSQQQYILVRVKKCSESKDKLLIAMLLLLHKLYVINI